MSYNPDQPRDERGRFGSGGGDARQRYREGHRTARVLRQGGSFFSKAAANRLGRMKSKGLMRPKQIRQSIDDRFHSVPHPELD